MFEKFPYRPNVTSCLQLNEHETVPFFHQSKPKFDLDLLYKLCTWNRFASATNKNNFKFMICTKRVNQQRISIEFWLNWRQNGTFSYSFTCTIIKIEIFSFFYFWRNDRLTKNLKFVFTLLLLHAFQGEFPMTSYWKEDKKGLIVLIW